MSADTVGYVAHEDNRDPSVRTRVWVDGTVLDRDYSLDQVSDHLQTPGKLVWVDLTSPDHAMLGKLAEELSLDPNAVEDAIAAHERPKAVRYPGYLFVTVYATRLDRETLVGCRISAFVLDHALVTVHDGRWRGSDDVVARWDDMSDLVAGHGAHALLYGLLDHVVDGQLETVEALEEGIDDLEDALFDERPPGRAGQRQQFRLRRSVVHLRRLVTPQEQLFSTLHTLRVGRAGQERRDAPMESFWADLEDHVARVTEWTDQARDLLNNVFSTTMSLQDARLNTVMKKLTSWAAIIAVPTAITGFYGQNVAYPSFGTTIGFVISTVAIVAAMAVLYVLFKRKDWL